MSSLEPRSTELVEQALAMDLAETQRLRRAKMAREAGLEPGEFARPFPGNQITVNHYHGQEPASPPPSPPAKPPKFEAVYEEQQPDGSWKVVRREPL